MKTIYDLNYARCVISTESEAILAMTEVVGEPFEQAVDAFFNCSGSVIVTGVGKAGIIGKKISATLASTGTPSHFLHPAEAVHGDLGRVQESDIILALSHSGESEEIIRLIDPIKQRQIKMVAITGDPRSRLAEHSDIVLSMGKLSEACPLGIAPSVSTTCMLAIGDALSFTVMKARNFSPEDYARFHPGGALGARLLTVGQTAMFTKDQSLPVCQMNDTIYDMLKQTSKIQRRGAVMVVDEKGRLAGIITDADLRRAITRYSDEVLGNKAQSIMTGNPKRVREDTLAAEAMAIFHKYRIDELPVVDQNDKPVGLIDIQDIVAIKIVG